MPLSNPPALPEYRHNAWIALGATLMALGGAWFAGWGVAVAQAAKHDDRHFWILPSFLAVVVVMLGLAVILAVIFDWWLPGKPRPPKRRTARGSTQGSAGNTMTVAAPIPPLANVDLELVPPEMIEASTPPRWRLLLRVVNGGTARSFHAKVVNLKGAAVPANGSWLIPWRSRDTDTSPIEAGGNDLLELAIADPSGVSGFRFLELRPGSVPRREHIARLPDLNQKYGAIYERDLIVDVMVWDTATSQSITRRLCLGFVNERVPIRIGFVH
jgi:hypothetical protein